MPNTLGTDARRTIDAASERGAKMTTLTVTSRGQVPLDREVLDHLGIQPGDKVELDLLPGGCAELTATRPKGTFKQLHGLLEGKTDGSKLSLDQINESIPQASAKRLAEHGGSAPEMRAIPRRPRSR